MQWKEFTDWLESKGWGKDGSYYSKQSKYGLQPLWKVRLFKGRILWSRQRLGRKPEIIYRDRLQRLVIDEKGELCFFTTHVINNIEAA